jgi:predicted permease
MTAPRGGRWRRFLPFGRAQIEAEVSEELKHHIESTTDELVARGMSRDSARAEALRRFGSVDAIRTEVETIDQLHERDRRRADLFDNLAQDLRYALRAIRRNPGFSAVVILTLALGIGANTAMFSVVNAVLLRPLPYHEPGRIARVYSAFRGQGQEQYAVSQPEFMDYKGLTNVFENAAAFSNVGFTLTGNGDPQRVNGLSVTRDFFPVMGIPAAQGRLFEGEDGRVGTEPIVIVTDAFWRNRYGADPAFLGQSVQLNGVSRRVAAILPPGSTYGGAEAFIPYFINPDSLSNRASNFLNVVARLRPGVSADAAHAQANALTRQLVATYPNIYPATMGFGATVISLHEATVGSVQRSLLILLGAVALVLVIACANVANLLLARGEARQREIAVRLALGASRRRVIGQLLTESVVLSLTGAVAGALFAWWATKAIIATNPGALPRADGISIDLTVGLVTLGLALLTGVAFGLAPAMHLVKAELQSALKEGSRGGSEGAHRRRIGRNLVSGEIALAVVVVIAATLLVRSFSLLQRVNPGFDPAGVIAMDLSAPAVRYDTGATSRLFKQITERAAALPGVTGAAATSDLPPASTVNNLDMKIDGREVAEGVQEPSPHVRAVTHNYFETLDIGLVKGRFFGPEDGAATEPVAIINEATARGLFPAGDAIGQRVRFSIRRPWMTIVGIARDVHSFGLGTDAPQEVYLLHEQLPASRGITVRTMYVVLRSKGDAAILAAPLRAAVKEIDPGLAINGVRTMNDFIGLSVAGERFATRLLAMFGALALTLAAIGIYGVMAYSVKRRTREMGIRMALGAQPRAVLGLVVGEGMRLSIAGLVAGLFVAFAASRLMEGVLYGIDPTDPIAFGAVAIILLIVALVASWIPARRAIAADATVALRSD